MIVAVVFTACKNEKEPYPSSEEIGSDKFESIEYKINKKFQGSIFEFTPESNKNISCVVYGRTNSSMQCFKKEVTKWNGKTD